jgi:phenylalanyl-tRNA synthetase alpha chain
MESLLQQIKDHKLAITAFTANNTDEVEQFRIKWLGTKGLVKAIMGEMRNVPNEQKKEFGQILNEFKLFAEARFQALQDQFAGASTASAGKSAQDLSLPGDAVSVGSRHPLTLVRNEMVAIFKRLGFSVAEGPEIEDDWHNFGAMNLPEDHPARDMQDTFFISKDLLLRTHTSPVQIRYMESHKPPIRIIAPGRVFRNEAISARSHCIFHQVEGLYVDKNVTFAELKGTLINFAKLFYGADVAIRFRPSFFPFTEPSAEMDVSCIICKGKGCRLCKYTGWLEILGCGMVDPNVFKSVNYDSELYTGYAFGMGIERIAMLKYGIDDIRILFENDLRFLKQFRGL